MDENQEDQFKDKIAGLLIHYNRYLGYMWNVEIKDPDIDVAVGFLNDENSKIDKFMETVFDLLKTGG